MGNRAQAQPKIPMARDNLEQIVTELRSPFSKLTRGQLIDRIENDVMPLLYRERTKPPTKRKSCSREVTAAIVRNVKDVHALNPELFNTEIANRFNINPGRVTEILKSQFDYLLEQEEANV